MGFPFEFCNGAGTQKKLEVYTMLEGHRRVMMRPFVHTHIYWHRTEGQTDRQTKQYRALHAYACDKIGVIYIIYWCKHKHRRPPPIGQR